MIVPFSSSTKAGKAGLTFTIDDADFKLVKDKVCYQHNMGYVMIGSNSLHRLLLDVKDPYQLVDHINKNKTDNSRANLRLCSAQQNAYNKGVYKTSQTGFKGVHFYKPRDKFVAYINFEGKRKHLGYFATAEEASIAYASASHKFHGEFASDHIKEQDAPPFKAKPKVLKSPPTSIANYYKYRDEKLRKQIIRNVKLSGKQPKDSTLEKHKIPLSEIQEFITA